MKLQKYSVNQQLLETVMVQVSDDIATKTVTSLADAETLIYEIDGLVDGLYCLTAESILVVKEKWS